MAIPHVSAYLPRDGKSFRRHVVAPVLPRPGDTIAGKYELVREIGEGGMGIVYEATHLRLRQRLAIKVLRPSMPQLEAVVERFEREARAAALLQSIHTARVIDVDTLPTGLPYMVLEFLEGRDLEAELQATGPMPVQDAVDIARQVADAMSEAHSVGIVHRDLKPSNLFVCRVGECERTMVKVLDFGISKIESEQERLTPSQEYFGTPHYSAPEQLRAACSADARSDVWSLGAILFELLTGRTPFVGPAIAVITEVVCEPVPSPTDFRPDLPRGLARIVMRALEREPADRFRTMRELALALKPFGPEKEFADAMAERPPARGRLGEILLAEGLLTHDDLARALAEQSGRGGLLGRVLLDLGLVSQADLLTALAKQHGLIVTPETSGVTDFASAATVCLDSAPQSFLRTRRRWPNAPLAVGALGLATGVLVAICLAGLMKSHAASRRLVAPSSSSSPVLFSTEVSAVQSASPVSLPTLTPTPLPPPRRGSSAPQHSSPRAPKAFDPNEI